ncbi:MAG: head decoration protein [Microbispora sp.]|nr:head decoration protein [Microbispora sp.]
MATRNPQIPSASSETFTPDRLIAGVNIGPVTEDATLVSGQNLTRGAVLGRITASGKLTLSTSAANDGSETPYAILAEDTDASGGDKTCTVYVAGEFNANALTFGTGHTATTAATVAALRDAGIYLKNPVAA